jgi:hypothetical protein
MAGQQDSCWRCGTSWEDRPSPNRNGAPGAGATEREGDNAWDALTTVSAEALSPTG